MPDCRHIAAPICAFAIVAALASAWEFASPGSWAHAQPSRTTVADADLRDPATITICTLPLGKYDRRLLRTAESGIQYLYGFSIKRLEARAMPRKAYYKPRKRYRAEKLLDYINERVRDPDCFAVIGFTRLDISTTKGDRYDWGILGLGEVGGTAAVVSSYRLVRRVKRRMAGMRTIKVVNHELGHVLGLDHYDGEAGCVMNDAKGTVKTVDREKGLLCQPSRDFLRKEHQLALPEHRSFDWRAVELPR